MVEINKEKDANGYDRFKIITDDGNFNIMFGGNLDLYWFYWPKENINDWPLFKKITITKENYFLYQKIDELYENIKAQRPYQKNEKDEYATFLEEIDLSNLNESKETDYAYEKLFQDGIIKWYSDDAPLEEASRVEIEKIEEAYAITFYQGKEEYNFPTFSVRFRNSGSRYQPYNFTFMDMYNCLSEYDPNYHQIHIEEYLYTKKLQKLKK